MKAAVHEPTFDRDGKECLFCGKSWHLIRPDEACPRRPRERVAAAHADTRRLDWLERNLMHLSHERAANSVDMGGICVRGQLVNEARGSEGGPGYFRVAHRSIREAIDAAMQQPEDGC